MVEANAVQNTEEIKDVPTQETTDEPKAVDAVAAGEGEAPAKKKKKRNKKKKAATEGDDLGLDAPEEEKKSETPAADGEAGDGTESAAKKKRNKKKKNKGGAGGGPPLGKREQDNSELRMLGSWKAGAEWKQTVDYTIPVSQ